MNQELFVHNFLRGIGRRKQLGNMGCFGEHFFSYDLALAKRVPERNAVVILDKEVLKSQTTRRHARLIESTAMSLKQGVALVPMLDATRKEICAFYQPRLAAIERRFLRSHNVGTLHEYMYRYDDFAGALFNLDVPPIPDKLLVIWEMEIGE